MSDTTSLSQPSCRLPPDFKQVNSDLCLFAPYNPLRPLLSTLGRHERVPHPKSLPQRYDFWEANFCFSYRSVYDSSKAGSRPTYFWQPKTSRACPKRSLSGAWPAVWSNEGCLIFYEIAWLRESNWKSQREYLPRQ